MPSERRERLSKSFSKGNSIDGNSKEYVWGCKLSTETAEHTFSYEEEDQDTDYLLHTLFMKLAILGKGAKDGERHIIEATTTDFEKEKITITLANLTGGEGRPDMVSLEDLTFYGDNAVTFRLVEGSGPIHLTGQHFIDFPEDPVLSETVLEYTEDEATETEEESRKAKGGAKRKGDDQAGGLKKQRGKMDSSAVSTGDDDEEEDEEDEELDDEDLEEDDEEMASDEEEEDEEEEDEPESSPEKPTKKKGAKGKAAKAAPPKPAPKPAKAPAKKAGKKGKK